MNSGAYLSIDPKRIGPTLRLLQYFRRFLASDCQRCVDPLSGWLKRELTKEEARAKLWWLIDVAINRKAGQRDVPSRKWSSDYQRGLCQDQISLHNYTRRRVRPGINRFRTPEVQRRFGHLLAHDD